MEPRACGSLEPDAVAASLYSEPVPASGTALSSRKKNVNVLVGVTGSVAALKLPLLVAGLLEIPGTCVIRAWDRAKPLLFCPAMNTAMWEHPITAQHVEQLKGFGYTEVPCVAKKLACGDEGLGAMAEVWTIVGKVKEVLLERELLHQS
ncbi:phosphopantothenoylcysteine decarboxylase isoform X3 [Phascolarctos cinereus]|uniref:Phosphopantothenoylcysteine decarboxylase isoform X3 n=1 Tax=Phascolarctos cinereus TaxID=38626 RepID=A0A6P5L0H2_PHACI|nr:phosphopantothenoylcysteine decarboxylase isoform X3 [Phascolarctos cinereus]